MRWLAILMLFGCGDVRTSANLGDPLWVMEADLDGVALGEPEGEHRALFGWNSYGEGDLFDCYEETHWLLCGHRVEFQQQLQVGPSEIIPTLDGLRVPFFELPKKEQLLSRDGAVLAFGALGIYDDRNLDGMMETPTDRLLAESITPPDYRSLAIFREGPLHVFWTPFRDVFKCPDPPEGFSVARVWLTEDMPPQIRECRISSDTRLLVSGSNDDQTLRIQCTVGMAGIPLDIRLKSHDPMPLPANAVVTECTPRRVDFYVDNGSECDQFDPNFYQLRPNEVTPAWWPCQP